MQWEMAAGKFQYLQQSLVIATLSLIAIFLVKLFHVRTQFVKFKKNGLVRNYLVALAYDRISDQAIKKWIVNAATSSDLWSSAFCRESPFQTSPGCTPLLFARLDQTSRPARGPSLLP